MTDRPVLCNQNNGNPCATALEWTHYCWTDLLFPLPSISGRIVLKLNLNEQKYQPWGLRDEQRKNAAFSLVQGSYWRQDESLKRQLHCSEKIQCRSSCAGKFLPYPPISMTPCIRTSSFHNGGWWRNLTHDQPKVPTQTTAMPNVPPERGCYASRWIHPSGLTGKLRLLQVIHLALSFKPAPFLANRCSSDMSRNRKMINLK